MKKILELTAKDIMTSPVLMVNEKMSVEEVSNFLTNHMISGAPVTNDQGRPIGVVTLSDIVRNEPRREHIIEDKIASDFILKAWEAQMSPDEMRGYHLEEGETLLVRDILTPFIFRVNENTTVQEIIEVMLSGRIHRIFVTRNNEIIGVVTTLDILKTLLSTNE